MTADLVIRGAIVTAATPAGLKVVEAIAVANGRVVAVGRCDEVRVDAGARLIDVGNAAVIPGLHDFHLHLVGLARSTRAVLLDDAADAPEIATRISVAASGAAPDAWIG
ncbi:MAG: hypothetical protein M3473_06050, partial [Chloroflexota bacterium]|nr:hypothetical protein [Chloroflexota bacterium]